MIYDKQLKGIFQTLPEVLFCPSLLKRNQEIERNPGGLCFSGCRSHEQGLSRTRVFLLHMLLTLIPTAEAEEEVMETCVSWYI